MATICNQLTFSKGDDPQCGWASANRLEALREKPEVFQRSSASKLQHELLPESPACQPTLQILDLTRPCNHRSQFFKINLFTHILMQYIYICIYVSCVYVCLSYWFSLCVFIHAYVCVSVCVCIYIHTHISSIGSVSLENPDGPTLCICFNYTSKACLVYKMRNYR